MLSISIAVVHKIEAIYNISFIDYIGMLANQSCVIFFYDSSIRAMFFFSFKEHFYLLFLACHVTLKCFHYGFVKYFFIEKKTPYANMKTFLRKIIIIILIHICLSFIFVKLHIRQKNGNLRITNKKS